jgi:general secretion pathway protein M
MISLKGRERKLIGILAAVLAVLLFQALVISPALKKRADLSSQIGRAKKQLVVLRALKREYDVIRDETQKINQRVSRRPPGFALFSFLDQTASRLNLKNNLTSMKPSRRVFGGDLAEDMVEVRLEGVSLENLVAYLYEIEKPGTAIAIASIRVQPESRLGGGLNVSMLMTSVSPGTTSFRPRT